MTALTRFVAALVLGLLAGLRWGGEPWAVYAGWIAAAAGLAVSTWRTRGHASAVLVGAVLLGAALGAAGGADAATDCRSTIADGARIQFRGVVASQPLPDASVELVVDALAVGGDGWEPCAGSVRMRPPRGALPPVARSVVVSGRWFAFPPESRWPVQPERTGFLAASAIDTTAGGAHRAIALRAGAQERLRALLPTRAPVAEALLLARRDGLDPELRRRFAESGLTHLLAISGTHVGLVAGVLLLVAGVARLPTRAAAAASAGGTVCYVLLLGAPHAASRAALQLVAILAARSLQRPAEPYTLLATSALLLVLIDPLAPLDAGFQLSFAGIFGLLAWRRPIAERLPPRLPASVRDGLAAGTAATLATGPIAALHFGIVAPIAIVANLAAIPIVAAAVPALALVLLVGAVSSSAGAFLGHGADVLLRLLDSTAAASAAVPGGHAAVTRPTVLAALAGTAIAILVVRRFETAGTAGTAGPAPHPALRRSVGAAVVVTALVAWPLAVRLTGDGALVIHAIDVGQGDALAVRTPAGRWIVIDAGPRTDRFDAGRARVVPFLLENGARRIDLLVLTHPHADHIGGAEAVFETFDVAAVVDPAVPSGSALYVTTLAAGRLERARWLGALEGRVLRVDDVVLEFLAPSASELDPARDPNDYSVVFRLGFGRFGALFLGDAPAAVEEAMISQSPSPISSQVIKVGHHGSRTSTGEALLDAATPSVALVSVGRRNRYGHPDPTVIGRLARRGVRILRTDLHGTVTIRASATGDVELLTSR